MRTRLSLFAATASVALAMLAVTGCGNDGSDAPAPPEGYKTYRGKLVSFDYPGDWAVDERRPGKVVIQPPTSARPRSGIQLNEEIDLRGTFDTVVDARTDFAKGAAGGGQTTTKEEEVDLDGAERAIRYEGKATIAGEDFDAGGISVLTKDDDGAFLSVDILESDGRPEVDTIVDSLRVNGS